MNSTHLVIESIFLNPKLYISNQIGLNKWIQSSITAPSVTSAYIQYCAQRICITNITRIKRLNWTRRQLFKPFTAYSFMVWSLNPSYLSLIWYDISSVEQITLKIINTSLIIVIHDSYHILRLWNIFNINHTN